MISFLVAAAVLVVVGALVATDRPRTAWGACAVAFGCAVAIVVIVTRTY